MSSEIKIFPLGAGRDVGRSCIILMMGGKKIMLDCGVHMGIHDEKKYPDFRFLCGENTLDNYIDLVLVSHFHLDHCASLPYMTEMIGYSGPIYMSAPTKAICPILLNDFRKVCDNRLNNIPIYTEQMVTNCVNKISTIKLHECIKVTDEIEIKAYYAGHVLGAVMFHIKVGELSAVYTGDFNMTSDSHLGSAWIDRCYPNVLITESTYATTIRESRKCREIDFLRKIHDTVEKGGKVLIPVFALGRAQELCILLEEFWIRSNLKVPIYYSGGMAEKANLYYQLFISWTNEYIKSTHHIKKSFEFKYIKIFEREFADMEGPMVLLASPGMLHAGTSLYVFRKWAHDPKNTVILPGYCVKGTIGHKVLAGEKIIEMDGIGDKTPIHVNLTVCNMSFSAHADAIGIFQLINFCRPKNAVVLVHGEGYRMDGIKSYVKDHFSVDCLSPENGELITIKSESTRSRISIPSKFIDIYTRMGFKRIKGLVYFNKNGFIMDPVNIFNKYPQKLLYIKTQLKFTKNYTIVETNHPHIAEIKNYMAELVSYYKTDKDLLNDSPGDENFSIIEENCLKPLQKFFLDIQKSYVKQLQTILLEYDNKMLLPLYDKNNNILNYENIQILVDVSSNNTDSLGNFINTSKSLSIEIVNRFKVFYKLSLIIKWLPSDNDMASNLIEQFRHKFKM